MAVTGWKIPGTATEDARSGATSSGWWDTSNGDPEDTISLMTSQLESTYVGDYYRPDSTPYGPAGPFHATIDKNSHTNYIRGSNFGFTTSDIPSGATIDGVEIRIRDAGHTPTPSTQGFEDMALCVNSTPQGTAKNPSDTIPGTGVTGEVVVGSGGDFTYGGATDKWGWTGIADTDVRASSFGIRWSVYCDSSFSGDGTAFDTVEVRVYYTSTGPQSITAGKASETETAQAVSPLLAQTVTVTASSETETTQAVAADMRVGVAAATETEQAEAVVALTTIAVTVGKASESETAEPVSTFLGAVAVGVASETETAEAIAVISIVSVSVGVASETETSVVVAAKQLAQLRSSSNVSVSGWQPQGAATVWQAVENDDASYAEPINA